MKTPELQGKTHPYLSRNPKLAESPYILAFLQFFILFREIAQIKKGARGGHFGTKILLFRPAARSQTAIFGPGVARWSCQECRAACSHPILPDQGKSPLHTSACVRRGSVGSARDAQCFQPICNRARMMLVKNISERAADTARTKRAGSVRSPGAGAFLDIFSTDTLRSSK